MEVELQKFREIIFNLSRSKGQDSGVSYPKNFKPTGGELDSFTKKLKKIQDPTIEFYVISEKYSENYYWGKSAIYYSYYHSR